MGIKVNSIHRSAINWWLKNDFSVEHRRSIVETRFWQYILAGDPSDPGQFSLSEYESRVNVLSRFVSENKQWLGKERFDQKWNRDVNREDLGGLSASMLGYLFQKGLGYTWVMEAMQEARHPSLNFQFDSSGHNEFQFSEWHFHELEDLGLIPDLNKSLLVDRLEELGRHLAQVTCFSQLGNLELASKSLSRAKEVSIRIKREFPDRQKGKAAIKTVEAGVLFMFLRSHNVSKIAIQTLGKSSTEANVMEERLRKDGLLDGIEAPSTAHQLGLLRIFKSKFEEKDDWSGRTVQSFEFGTVKQLFDHDLFWWGIDYLSEILPPAKSGPQH